MLHHKIAKPTSKRWQLFNVLYQQRQQVQAGEVIFFQKKL